jgi:carboxyl-terminal processing protease
MLHINMRSKQISLLLLMIAVGAAIWAGCETAKSSDPEPVMFPDTGTNAWLNADPNDPRIAFVTGLLLGEYHYLQEPLDTRLSEKFYDGYLDSLDSRHENFLQSDLAEFSIYRTNLDTLTMGKGSAADLTPAYVIFGRFIERLKQHADYVNDLLKQGAFKFNTDETIQVDRRHEPFPKDLAAAHELWRQQLRYEYLQEKLAQEIHDTNGVVTVELPAGATTNIVDTLTRHYSWNLRMMTNLDGDSVLQVYLEALAHAYDPHSDYFSAPHAQDFSIDMSLSLFGIGAQLREDDGYCTIKDLVPGGPADKSKALNPEDRIVAVAQGNEKPLDVVDMDLEKVVQRIRGPKGTEVRLTISPADDRAARKVVTLVRDEIKLEDREAKAQLIVQPDGRRLGVIDLPSFYASVPLPGNENVDPKYTSADVARLIKKLKQEKVDGIILDLRSNPGGSLEEAVKFTGLFIKDGPVVLARSSDGQISVDSDPDPSVLYDGPLVVMINRYSASASEIAAAALQDYGRALIVGDTSTFGKGSVQSLNPLRPFVEPVTASATNDPGTLKITKGKFYRVTGGSTQFKGVASDIVLPDILDHSLYAGETALDNPLPWDTIQPVAFDKLDRVQPYLAELRKASAARVATNQDFQYVQRGITEYEANQADKTSTLNEQKAVALRRQLAGEQQAEDMELNNRPVSAARVYDITLEKSGDPGLPKPASYFTTNDVTANDTRPSPIFYFKTSDNLMVPLPDRPATVSVDGTNVVASWTNLSDIKWTMNPVLSNSVDTAANTLSVTNPVTLKRVSPDAALEETKNILEDYISLLSKNAIQVANH